MAFVTVTQAVAKIVLDAKLSVVKDLVAFLSSKVEMEDLTPLISEFTESLKDDETKEMKATIKDAKKKSKKMKEDSGEIVKKKREPTAYNLYVSDMMPSFKEKHPDITNGRLLMTMLGEEWKESDMGIFLSKKVPSLKSKDDDLSIQDAYNQAKEAWESGDHEVEEVEKKVKGKVVKAKPVKAKSDDDEESKSDDEEESKTKPVKEVNTKPVKEVKDKPVKAKPVKEVKAKLVKEVKSKSDEEIVSDDETLVATDDEDK